jgi:hypothetical protein
MYFTRPQSLVSAAAILGYLVLFQGRVFVSTLPVFGMCLLALVMWSSWAFGQPLPPSVYGTFRPETEHLARNTCGLLISPSRGLLIFCPVLLFIAWALIRYLRALPSRRLLLPAAVAISGHFAVLACFNEWHGGCCYGPRYLTDVLPWAVLLSAQTVRGMIDYRTTSPGIGSASKLRASAFRFSRLGRTLLLVCIAWSVWIHARGAISHATWRWNYSMERNPQTAPFDWRDPQFLARR